MADEATEMDVAPKPRRGRPPKPVAPEIDAGPTPKSYDEITYIPGPHDPSITRVNGITFRANVPVKVPHDKTVQVPLVKSHEHQDGSITTKAYETRIRMAVQLADNPCFSINGKPPRPRKKAEAKMPATPEQYKNYATHWIAESDDAAAMDARWEGEEHLRTLCGVTESDIATIMMFFNAKHGQCEGTSHLHVPQM
jgi:hypothetical protein